MLDQNTSAQLKTLLERLEGPIELVATLNGSEKSDKIKEFTLVLLNVSSWGSALHNVILLSASQSHITLQMQELSHFLKFCLIM